MSDSFYHTQRWRRLAAACLRRDPICRTPGCTERASHADHVIPREEGGPDDLSNLRGLCASCHNRRSARKNTPPRLAGCDAAGAPRDPTHWWRS